MSDNSHTEQPSGATASESVKEETSPVKSGPIDGPDADAKREIALEKSDRGKEDNTTTTASYDAGQLVLVKIQGFPWWPAVIVTPEHFPPQALQARPSTKPRKDGASPTIYPVQFLGTPEYYWSKPSDVKILKTDEVKSWLESGRKANSKGLKAAYQQAMDKPSLDSLMEAKHKIASNGNLVDEEDDSMDVDELDPELDDEGKPVKKNKKKTNRTPKGSDNKTPVKRRKSEATEGETSVKKAKTSAKKSSARVNGPEPSASPELTQEESDKRARANKVKTVMYLRHKLQKTLLGKDEPKGADLEEIPGHLDKLDDVEVDIDIFRETKIGKVLLRIKRLESIPQDEKLGIKTHVNKLLNKWQDVMTELGRKSADGNESPSVEDGSAAPQEVKGSSAPQESKEPTAAPQESKESNAAIEPRTEEVADESEKKTAVPTEEKAEQ